MSNTFKDVTSLEELIPTLMGASSMCWSNIPGAGFYDAAKAAEIGQEAHSRLMEILEEALAQIIAKAMMDGIIKPGDDVIEMNIDGELVDVEPDEVAAAFTSAEAEWKREGF